MPFFETIKRDEPSEALLKERASGDIKKKRGIKVVEVSGKRTKPTLNEILLDVQSRAAIARLQKASLKKLSLTEIDKEEMFTVCRLGYDGIIENKGKLAKAMESFKKKRNIPSYEKVLAPLFNMIVGHKTLKDNCPRYITKKELATARNIYEKTKAETTALSINIVDMNEDIEAIDFITPKRKLGLLKPFGRTVPPVRYNVHGLPVRYPEHFYLAKEILQFEKMFDRKKAIWQGIKTRAFKSWLTKEGIPFE